MKKYMLLISVLFLILPSCSKETTQSPEVSNTPQESLQPERKVDIYGKIVSMEWNEITLLQVDTSKDPTFNMTPTQKKKYMQSMDESARMALKEEINKATLWEIKLIVPIGIEIMRKTASWPDAPNVEASIADFKVWQYISVWLNTEIKEQKVAEFVKISFTQ